MDGQTFKTLVNYELDVVARRELGRLMTVEERRAWWLSPQGGVEEPAMLVVAGEEEERDHVLAAARQWKPIT
jgi:hypothetical protein